MSISNVIEKKLDKIARRLKLDSKPYKSGIIQIDRVWYLDIPLIGKVPVLAIEIEAYVVYEIL